VAIIGGIFGWRSDHHLEVFGVGAEAEGVAFIKAFKDVFIIGSSLGLLAAVVFLIGGWRLVPAEPLIDGQATQPVGAGEVGLD
jgi:hypothetical protein